MSQFALQNRMQSIWDGTFTKQPEIKCFAPGRVNLIGEHLDYNGGPVMPMAISNGIWGYYSKRSDGEIKMLSLDYPDSFAIDSALTDPKCGATAIDRSWELYPIAVIEVLKEKGVPFKGGNFLFGADLARGSGLSSSAALEVLTAYMILLGNGEASPDLTEIALIAQEAESKKVGVHCGIMDQFTVARAIQGHALLLDCSTLAFQQVPLNIDNSLIAIINTNKSRKLTSSKYNERRSECETAVSRIRQRRDIDTLAQARDEDLSYLSDFPVELRRARHVISETARVSAAASYLADGNLHAFGKLLNESHASLKDDYDVTGFELDALVEIAQSIPGCYGARMTGAGFGGCAIALINKEISAEFEEEVGKRYYTKTQLQASFFYSRGDAGVSRI